MVSKPPKQNYQQLNYVHLLSHLCKIPHVHRSIMIICNLCIYLSGFHLSILLSLIWVFLVQPSDISTFSLNHFISKFVSHTSHPFFSVFITAKIHVFYKFLNISWCPQQYLKLQPMLPFCIVLDFGHYHKISTKTMNFVEALCITLLPTKTTVQNL